MNKYKVKIQVLTQKEQLTYWVDFDLIIEAENHRDAIDKIESIVAPAKMRVLEIKQMKKYAYKDKE